MTFGPDLSIGARAGMTVKDGGVNDADRAVNGSVSDPGGVGMTFRW